MTLTIGILGTGAWPLSIAALCSENGYPVRIWCYRDEIVEEINSTRTYSKSLNQYFFKSDVHATADMQSVVSGSDVIIFGIASSYIHHVETLSRYASKKPILILTKGLLNSETDLFVSDYVKKWCKESPVALLSGPNIAKEIISGLPAATVIASEEKETAVLFQSLINHPNFRVYTSTDLKGVEIGGVLKNIMAIAAGCCDGLGYGVNAKSALLTRGLQEMIRFSSMYSAQSDTLMGLSGLGDLIATCHSENSRNYKFGFLLGKGYSKEAALKEVNRTVEGVNTLAVVHSLALKTNIDMPIMQEVYQVVFNGKTPKESIVSLMSRMVKSE